MIKHNISLTLPNDEWLKIQVDSQEYASKSEVINDLIRKAREIAYIRAKLIWAEQGEFSTQSVAEILSKSKDELQRFGEL